MIKRFFTLLLFISITICSIPFSLTTSASAAATPTPIQVYGTWLCSNDYCEWSTVRDMTEFDRNNHWLIDRGDNKPSVNLVVFAFANPLKMLQETDTGTFGMLPPGMTSEMVSYFKTRGVRVMISIGGITYADDWDTALAADPTQLGLNAARIAQELGVGIEIDYENDANPNLAGLQSFIDAYRSQIPYDPTGVNHAARLTIDVASDDWWLIDLNRYATTFWLNPAFPVLDYANAMVADPKSGNPTLWKQHISGTTNISPAVPALAPAKLTGSLYLTGKMANCKKYSNSEQKKYASALQTMAPKGIGETKGMLGYMFWVAQDPPGDKNLSTAPPNSCEKGIGKGAATFKLPIPMPALRQK